MPQYYDLRHIVVKLKIGGYTSLAEIVHDLRQIVYCARLYLSVHPNNYLATAIADFSDGIESVLGDPAMFGNWDFAHIVGCPGEPLSK